MIEKNERTKAKIRRRDELRRQRQDKLLEESALQASVIIAQKKRALDYCTARTNFGAEAQEGKPIRRINNFKRRPNSQLRKLSPKRVASKSRDQTNLSPLNKETINLDLKVDGRPVVQKMR